MIFIPKLSYKIEHIEDAYRRWKHFIYHDNNYLLYRWRIAEFECAEVTEEEMENVPPEYLVGESPLEKRLQRLLFRLHQIEIDWSDWEKETRPFPVPKKLRGNGDDNNSDVPEHQDTSDCDSGKNANVVIHNAQPKTIKLESVTWLIDCPVEIHLISVLWVLRNGMTLQEKFKKSNYGNLLAEDLSINKEGKGLALFTPYHINYKRWRDQAIKKAKALVSDRDDVLMIGLDIKDYYHSVQLSKRDYFVETDSPEWRDERLNNILFEVAKNYFRNNFPQSLAKRNKYGLPIGLVSSSVLANSYLNNFDHDVREKMQPAYYGRYVDDILIVLRCPEKCSNEGEVRAQAEKYLIRVLSEKDEKDEKDEKCQRTLLKRRNLSIQQSKVLLYYFDADEPLTLLEKFIREIRETSSEYRFLPTEDDAKTTFEDAAFSIHYEGSKTKLRSIRDFTSNRFGVSSFLAKLIFGAIRVDKIHSKDTARQIYTFFRGGRAIEMFSLWEKAFTYMVVTQNKSGLAKLRQNISQAISQLEKHGDRAFTIDGVKRSLNDHLHAAQQMALSLHPKLDFESFGDLGRQLRRSNLVRHAYVNYPLVNFLQTDDVGEAWSYLNFDWQEVESEKSIQDGFRVGSWKFSPRFVHFHELVLIWTDRFLSLKTEKPRILPQDYLEQVFSIYYAINYRKTKPVAWTAVNVDEKERTARGQYFHLVLPEQSNSAPQISSVAVAKGDELKISRIALANLEVSSQNIRNSYLRKPNLSPDRRDDLYAILNQITRQKGAELLVLPEVSVPYRWVSLLCDRSRKENMATVFGLEHWVKGAYAYNILVTLLPVKINVKHDAITGEHQGNFDAVIPIFRLKNHYSPSEIKDLEGHHLKVPKPEPPCYHLFSWRGLRFTTFNCFELADISHRSVFRSKIDLLVACEFNRDIPYFSNIAESASRDLHCYFVQANTSEYGDSRIIQPVKSEIKDILRIKGGKNPTVLIEQVNLTRLREFQYKHWNLQLDDKDFKPTPPGFDRRQIAERLKLDTSIQKLNLDDDAAKTV